MLEQFAAIVRNTFFESIRQPIVLVILMIATLGLIFANTLSAFTMADDQRMMIDMGLATVFVSGALLAAFVATGVLTREIENKTVLTVVSKPVSRPLFVLGKYFGVAGALLICTVYLVFVFVLVELHGVLQTVRDPIHAPVVVFGVGAFVIATVAAVWSNYFYGRVFSSTMICFLAPLSGLAYLFALMFKPDFTPQEIGVGFDPNLWRGIITLLVAVMVMTSVAIAASARLSQMLTVVVTMGVFMVGLLSDYLIGRRIHGLEEQWLHRATLAGKTESVERILTFQLTSGEVQTSPIPELIDVPVAGFSISSLAEGSEMIQFWLYKVVYAVVPNFQVLYLSDALTQDHIIPGSFVTRSVVYGSMCIIFALALAVALFQRREVG